MFPQDINVRVYRYPADFPLELARAILNLILPVRGYLLVATTEPRHVGDERHYRLLADDVREALEKKFPNDASRYFSFLPIGQMLKIPVDCCEVYTPKENMP
ncbi:MAG: hypothetical protein ACEQSB_01270 [Undibacterium sp.]